MVYDILGAMIVAIISVIAFKYYFYRDPERQPPDLPNIIISPADGWVREIKEIKSDETPIVDKKGHKITLKDITQFKVLYKYNGGYLIGIYMSPFDVHVNRAPINGRVVKTHHIKGKKRPLFGKNFKAVNERNTILIENEDIQVALIQIASHFARRIECYIKEGQELFAGERIGMIRLSSQVDIIIPKLPGLKLKVKKGTRVKAGKTILGVYKNG